MAFVLLSEPSWIVAFVLLGPRRSLRPRAAEGVPLTTGVHLIAVSGWNLRPYQRPESQDTPMLGDSKSQQRQETRNRSVDWH